MWDNLFVSSRASHVRDLSRGIQGAPTEDIKDPGELLGGRSGEKNWGAYGGSKLLLRSVGIVSCDSNRFKLLGSSFCSEDCMSDGIVNTRDEPSRPNSK